MSEVSKINMNGEIYSIKDESARKKADFLDEHKASKEEVEVERQRINNLASLPNGSTTGDAELIDTRVGADGVTYPSAGEAIRSQIGALSGVKVSETEPTSENVEIWVNPNEDESYNVPEIKDDQISEEDTWSSSKINSELTELKGDLGELDSRLSESITDISNDVKYIVETKRNYFDKSKTIEGKFYDGNVGSALYSVSSSGYRCALVEVEPNHKYVIARSDYNVFEVDENLIVTNKLYPAITEFEKVITPIKSNTKYIAITWRNVSTDEYMVLDEGVSFTKYIPYPKETYVTDAFTDNIKKKMNVATPNIYTVGKSGSDFTGLIEALTALKNDTSDKVIYIKAGTYDLYSELGGADFLHSITSSTEWTSMLIVPDNTSIVGIGDVRLIYNPPSSDFTHYNQISCVSPLTVFGNFNLENVTIEATNCRYCIHDESYGITIETSKKKTYKNVILIKHENTYQSSSAVSGQAYGCGFNPNYDYEFDSCEFYSEETHCFTMHTNSGNNSSDGGTIILKNCVFESPRYFGIRFGSGWTDKQIRVLVKIESSYSSGAVLLTRESEGNGGKNCFDLHILNSNMGIDDKYAEKGWTNIYTPIIRNIITNN